MGRRVKPEVLVVIDLGTDGVSVGLWIIPEKRLWENIGTGQYSYLDVPGRRHNPEHWLDGIREAMGELHRKCGGSVLKRFTPKALVITGMMHGFTPLSAGKLPIMDDAGSLVVGSVLWNDPVGENEAQEIAANTGEPTPARLTAARALWFSRQYPGYWSEVTYVATPAVYVALALTGEFGVGPGEGSGMAGKPAADGTLDAAKLDGILPGLAQRFPRCVMPGQMLGRVNRTGAELLGLPEGLPVPAPEGDQPVIMGAGACSEVGEGSAALGQSVVLNVPVAKPILDQRGTVDAFWTMEGKPFAMTCVRSGCTPNNQLHAFFMQFAQAMAGKSWSTSQKKKNGRKVWDVIETMAADVAPGSGGILSFPYTDGEPTADVNLARGIVSGLGLDNFTAGHVFRSFLEASSLLIWRGWKKMGSPELKRLTIGGGGSRSRSWGEIIGALLNKEVQVLARSDEANLRGAAALGLTMLESLENPPGRTLAQVAKEIAQFERVIKPSPELVAAYTPVTARFERALLVAPPLLTFGVA